jgi:excisionase family DNA binding protein
MRSSACGGPYTDSPQRLALHHGRRRDRTSNLSRVRRALFRTESSRIVPPWTLAPALQGARRRWHAVAWSRTHLPHKLVGRAAALAVNNRMGANLHAEPGNAVAARESLDAPWKAGPQYLTADQVAARLEVLPSWVNKAARANRIPHVRVGRYRRFRWPDIEAWLDKQRSDA